MHDDLKNLSLDLEFTIDKSFDSDRFIKIFLRVCHDKINPNNSNFELDVLSAAEESIKNIPILASVILDQDGNPRFNSHDMHIENNKLKDGEYKLIYDEQPIGVVYESAPYTIKEYNGKNYVFTEAYIWRGYSNYAEELIETIQNIHLSMEVEILNYVYNSKTKIYDIKEFKFKGITLLDNSIGTGMVDALASIESFSVSEKNKEYLFILMNELKEEIQKNQSSNPTEVDINSFSKKEEVKVLKLTEDQINELLNKYNLKLGDINFNIDEIKSIEMFEEKLVELSKDSFSLSAGQFIDELIIELRKEKIKDRWGDEYSRYSYYDHKDGELYAIDRSDNYKLFGFTYSINNDSVLIDFESKKRKKIEIVDFVDGETETSNALFDCINESIEFGKNDGIKETHEIYKDYDSIKSTFNEYKENYKTPENEVILLRKFRDDTLEAERSDAESILFANFDEKLKDNEEYKTLKVNAKNYDLETLTDKCYAILGKTQLNINFNLTNNIKSNQIKLAVDQTTTKDDPYNGLIKKHTSK